MSKNGAAQESINMLYLKIIELQERKDAVVLNIKTNYPTGWAPVTLRASKGGLTRRINILKQQIIDLGGI